MKEKIKVIGVNLVGLLLLTSIFWGSTNIPAEIYAGFSMIGIIMMSVQE